MHVILDPGNSSISRTIFNRHGHEWGARLKHALEIHTLGGLRAQHNSEPLSGLASRKALALLAYLAVTEMPQSRDHLAALFWPDRSQTRARGNLRVALSSLRKQLEPLLQIEHERIGLKEGASYWVDAIELRHYVESRSMSRAAELYRGEFLQGFHVPDAPEFDQWAMVEREHLRQMALEALQTLVERCLYLRNYREAAKYAREMVGINPLAESAHRNLMRALALSDQRDRALAQYEECRRILGAELAIQPSMDTRILLRQIRAGYFSPDFPTFASRYDLPEKLTPFIGRERELREIGALLGEPNCRLITIIGPGGVGKSRLAVEAARAHYAAFPDGEFYLSLAGFEAAESVIPGLVEVMQIGVGTSTDPRDWLLTFLRDKKALLILDNFEHILEATEILNDILRTASRLQVLATSRVSLRLPGETRYMLSGMRVPLESVTENLNDYAGVKMFVNCAQMLRQDFPRDPDDLAQAAEICRLVDGLPLAIELAASWVGVLSAGEIAAEIRRGVGLLESDLEKIPERQRSFRAVFGHSWALLTAREQTILCGLSLFQGGFDRAAAESVTGGDIGDLRALVNKSLIAITGAGRYKVHELLRQYAHERLVGSPGVEDHLRGLHADYFMRLVQRQDARLKGAEQENALEDMRREIRDIRPAWEWILRGGNLPQIRGSIDPLCRFYQWRRRDREGERACRMAIEALGARIAREEEPSARIELLRIMAKALTWHGAFLSEDSAREAHRRAAGILTELEASNVDVWRERAFLLEQMGHLEIDHDLDAAGERYEGAFALYEQLRDDWGRASTLMGLGWVAGHTGDFDAAGAYAAESIGVYRGLASPRGTADALWLLGILAIMRDELGEAERLISEGLRIRKRLGERVADIPGHLMDIGMALTWIGKVAEAVEVREEALAIFEERGTPHQIAAAHVRLATALMHFGDFSQAAIHAQKGSRMAREIGDLRSVGIAMMDLTVAELDKGDGEGSYARCQEGVAALRDVPGSAELGWLLGLAAIHECWRGKYEDAKGTILEALELGEGMLGSISVMIALYALGLLFAHEGRSERAIELIALAERYPIMAQSHATQDFVGPDVREIEAGVPADVRARAKARGRALDLMETRAELIAELRGELAGE